MDSLPPSDPVKPEDYPKPLAIFSGNWWLQLEPKIILLPRRGEIDGTIPKRSHRGHFAGHLRTTKPAKIACTFAEAH